MKTGQKMCGWVVKLPNIVIHKCDKCSRVFHKLEGLNNHRAHHEQYFLSHVISAHVQIKRSTIHSCESCNQSFLSKKDYVFHRIKHLRDNAKEDKRMRRIPQIEARNGIYKPYECPKCDLAFVAKITLDEHSIVHLPFPNICDCGIGYYKKQDLLLHRKLVHGYEPNSESKINSKQTNHEPKEGKLQSKSKPKTQKKTIKQNKLVKQINKTKGRFKRGNPNAIIKRIREEIDIEVLPDLRAVCPACKKIFRSKSSVQQHYVIHTGERPYKCPQCDTAFTQRGALSIHIRRKHECSENEFVCRICSKSFTGKDNRDRHELIHGEKMYECPFCGKAFHDPSALCRHKRIHTGDKRYRCTLCPKAFTDVSGLIGHKLRHGKKQFTCEICLKMFYTKQALDLHLDVHSKLKNYCCDYCKKYFKQKYNLAAHVRRHLKTPHIFIKNSIKKKYECNDCSFSSDRKDHMLDHYNRIHVDIRCDKCKQCFSSDTELARHRLKESVRCEICDETFYCKRLWHSHLNMHKGKQIKVQMWTKSPKRYNGT